MSAVPPKADMCGATRDFRFVPIADMMVIGSKSGKTGNPRLAVEVCWIKRTAEIADYFSAPGPTNLRPLGPVPLTWITVGSRIST
jgi:hypothetical protein